MTATDPITTPGGETRPSSTAPPPLRVASALDEVTAALEQLVPGWDGAGPLELVEVLAARLDGHHDCARLLNPTRGALTLDEVRGRCLALLQALAPVERGAVLACLTADVGEAGR